jgi:hypothetical protein
MNIQFRTVDQAWDRIFEEKLEVIELARELQYALDINHGSLIQCTEDHLKHHLEELVYSVNIQMQDLEYTDPVEYVACLSAISQLRVFVEKMDHRLSVPIETLLLY